jgi:NitT/TauT family transport system ATP-binding protein
LINIHDLHLSFSDDPSAEPLVDGLSLKLKPGEVHTLFGPNGTGKSSILSFLLGQEPARFRARFSSDSNWNDLPFAFVPQNAANSIMEWLSVVENVALPHRLQGNPQARSRKTALKISDGLLSRIPLDRLGSLLSGGEKQLTVLARELGRSSEPQFLLLDEAFSSMDYLRRFAAMAWVRRWCVDTGSIVLAISHSAEDATFFSDTVSVLSSRPMTLIGQVNCPNPEDRTMETLSNEDHLAAVSQIHQIFTKSEVRGH